MSAPSLPWLQVALQEQDAVPVKTQVNLAARRVDVLVGDGLRAAVQPDDDDSTVALHGALGFHGVATDEQKRALVDRLEGAVDDVEFAVVNDDWLAFRRVLPASAFDSTPAVGVALRDFLVASLDALKDADSDGIL